MVLRNRSKISFLMETAKPQAVFDGGIEQQIGARFGMMVELRPLLHNFSEILV